MMRIGNIPAEGNDQTAMKKLRGIWKTPMDHTWICGCLSDQRHHLRISFII
jgi:hypothetical protein